MEFILNLLSRKSSLFELDISENERVLQEKLYKANILVIGGAGSIGQATVKEIFKRKNEFSKIKSSSS